MTRFKRQSSSTLNGFHSLLNKPTCCESATFDDDLITFLQRSARVRKLVRSDGKMVDINSLRGKIVGLFVMSLVQSILEVASAYNELSKSKKGRFEIVWITNVDDHLQFRKYLKLMPWLAIPFTDSRSRNWLCSSIESKRSYGYEIFLFNREGKFITQGAARLFRIYGADWYPFTDTRMKEIADEDFAIEKNMSLKNLLGNARRDFVFRNNRTKVSISELENKVVGIYFCNADNPMRSCFARQLLEVYLQLKKQGKQFEVVMVHIGGWSHEELFEPEFKNMPWLSLPRADSHRNRLVRIFDPEMDTDNCLVIVGQRGSFVNKFGYSTITIYGIEAYPFSRLSVAEIEKKKLEVRVKSLLTCGDENYVIRKSGEKVEKMPISYLSGKTIVLLFASFRGKKNELVTKLIKWYAEIKEQHADFEVILVASGYDESSFDEYYGQMPWLAFPHNNARLETLCSELCLTYPTLAVFGPNAQLLSMRSERHFYTKGAEAYPFSGKDALTDMYVAVSFWYNWPLPYDVLHQNKFPNNLLEQPAVSAAGC